MVPKRAKGTTSIRILGCYFPFSLLLLLAVGLQLRSFWLISPLFFLFVIVPILDALANKDKISLESAEFSKTQLFIGQAAPYGFVVGYALILSKFILNSDTFSTSEFIMASISTGAVGSILITACHELIHKKSKLARYTARLGFASVMNVQFEYYHLLGHHREAATPLDNHTAWYGEAFPRYLLRTTLGYLRFIFDFEKTRLKRLGLKWIGAHNKLLWFFGIPTLIVFLLVLKLGTLAALFYIVQAIIAAVSLEAVSYIEHYGLLRNRVGDRYQKMGEKHSWNSHHRYSNYITFMLQRHADHHLNSTKDYFLLRASDFSPELPLGYPLLILIVGIPPLWFRMINPLIKNSELQTQTVNSPSAGISDSLSHRSVGFYLQDHP